MKLFKKIRQALSAAALSLMAVMGGGVVAAGSAYAALPTAVTDAFEAAKTDGVQAAGLVLVVIVSIVAFKYIRRAL